MELRPNAFEQTDMASLIEQLVQSIRARKSIAISTRIDSLPKLSTETRMQLFRIIQGALNNVVRHANANKMSITALLREQELILTISDDGQGFSIDQISVDSHGLSIMAERAEELGAFFNIDSSQGTGTTVEVRLPIDKV